MRVLVTVRVSRETDESSSAGSQRAGAFDYADTHPGTVLLWTDSEDLGVSGATAIATRPSVAPWLAPEKINEWDAIGVYEVDRLSRNMEDYLGFVRSMEKAGKVIIDLIDGTDTTTPEGRRTLEDRVLAAQRYRQSVAEKRARAAKRMSSYGRWGGGRVPYGYRPERHEFDVDGKTVAGFHLVRDAVTAPVARRMATDAIGGKGLLNIAGELNAEGIRSPLGRDWRDNSVRRVLTSPALMGYVTKMEGPNSSVVTVRRGRDGNPVKFTEEPILTPDEWKTLQDSLADRSRGREAPQARHLLWGVAFCRDCDAKMYGYRRTKHTSKGNAYHCKVCGISVRLERLESFAEGTLLGAIGAENVLERKRIAGSDFSAEIVRLERRAERLRSELDAEYDTDLESAVRKIEARIAEILSGPHEPDRIEWMPADPPVKVADFWASLDTSGRNKFLRDGGIRIDAYRDGGQVRLAFRSYYSADLRPFGGELHEGWNDVATEAA